MKCDIKGCTVEMSKMTNTPREDGIIVEVLNTKRAYMICTACATKMGLI